MRRSIGTVDHKRLLVLLRQIRLDAGMGRVFQQSNPTEMNVSWSPAGDDWASGWILKQQAYDWKGRPTITTNADGTTEVLTYGGCGCAGGEVTTVQDEHGRQRRLTKDTFGRLWKVEELNWNATVYATTTYSYNVRDQLIESNQATQLRSFGYDGYGRLSSRTTPEQGTTSYNYNLDDTTNFVIDARGAKTIFGYNPRHLVSSIGFFVIEPICQKTPTQNDVVKERVCVRYRRRGRMRCLWKGTASRALLQN